MTIVTLTDNALKQFKKILVDEPDKVISFGVNSGGCNGFSYKIDLADKEKADHIAVFDNVEIHIDKESLMFVLGTEIDYKTDLIGSTFTFSNPNAQAQCGCGTSFSA